MTYDEAALIEPLAVTVHAAKRFQDINGANVSIIGCGPIGILLMQSCKALGAAKVLITDISDYRLELAKSLGADYAINTAKVPYADAIAEVFGPDKADVTYECAGNNATTDMAIQNSRKGSVIVLVAVFADWAKVDLARLNDSELTLDTSMMYRHEDYVDALRFVAEGKDPAQAPHQQAFRLPRFPVRLSVYRRQPRTHHEGGRRHSGLNLLRKGNSYGYS